MDNQNDSIDWSCLSQSMFPENLIPVPLAQQSQPQANQNMLNLQNFFKGMMCEFNKSIEIVAKKVEKLDSMQKELKEIHTKINKTDEKVKAMEESINFLSGKYDDVLKGQTKVEKTVIKELNVIKKQVNETHDLACDVTIKNKELEEQLLDLQTRSMRENLIFSGIEEKPHENVENVLHEFIRDKLKIQEVISIDRCHRIGVRRQGKHRSIVAKFSHYKEREVVRAAAPSNLKDSNYGVYEQFPPEIARRRKLLYPILRQAKRDGKNAKLVADKLFVNGTRVYHDDRRQTDSERR